MERPGPAIHGLQGGRQYYVTIELSPTVSHLHRTGSRWHQSGEWAAGCSWSWRMSPAGQRSVWGESPRQRPSSRDTMPHKLGAVWLEEGPEEAAPGVQSRGRRALALLLWGGAFERGALAAALRSGWEDSEPGARGHSGQARHCQGRGRDEGSNSISRDEGRVAPAPTSTPTSGRGQN